MNEERSLNMSENKSLLEQKFLLLNICIEESIMLIENGIELFRKMFFENNENIALLSFAFLSRGFELLMKNILIFKYFKDNNKFILSKELSHEYGHNLIVLRDEISKNYQSLKINNEKIKNRIVEDKNFLESQELKDILETLNHFADADKGRYFAFNFLDCKESKELEYSINKLNCIILNRVKNNIPKLQEESEENKEILSYFWNREVSLNLPFLIYNLLIVLTRQFTYDFFGEKASKGRSTLISIYACMTEKDIFELAIEAFQEALELEKITLNKCPIKYAETQMYLGTAYANHAKVLDDMDDKKNKKTTKIICDCGLAIKAYQKALKVYNKKEYPSMYQLIQGKIKNVNEFLKKIRRVAKKHI